MYYSLSSSSLSWRVMIKVNVFSRFLHIFIEIDCDQSSTNSILRYGRIYLLCGLSSPLTSLKSNDEAIAQRAVQSGFLFCVYVRSINRWKRMTFTVHRSFENTYIVPLATVMLRLLSTWFGFDLLPYCLNACRTDTAFCWRLQTVPPSSIIDMLVSLPLKVNENKNNKINN